MAFFALLSMYALIGFNTAGALLKMLEKEAGVDEGRELAGSKT